MAGGSIRPYEPFSPGLRPQRSKNPEAHKAPSTRYLRALELKAGSVYVTSSFREAPKVCQPKESAMREDLN